MDDGRGRQVVSTSQRGAAPVRNGTAISLVILLLIILGAMAIQLAQAR